MLKNFFLESQQSKLLSCYNSNGTLTIVERQKVIRVIVDFMVSKFGTNVTSYQKKKTAEATILVFPCLKEKHSKDGIVCNENRLLYVERAKIAFLFCLGITCECAEWRLSQ